MLNRIAHVITLLKTNSFFEVIEVIKIWASDYFFDFGKKYNVDIQPENGKTYSTSNSERIKYGPTKHPSFIKFLLKKLNISRTDTIIDIGGGKGLGLMVFSLFQFKKIYSLEIHKELADISKKNIEQFITSNQKVKCNDYEIINANALEWVRNTQLEIKYFYIYLPFPAEIFNQFIVNLTSNKNIKECIFIIYLCNDEHWKYKTILENFGCTSIVEFNYFRNSPSYVYEYKREKVNGKI